MSLVLNDFYESNDTFLCLSECPTECTSIEYTKSISISNFPSIFYYERLTEMYSANFTSKLNKENHLALNIYYDSMSYTTFDEIPKLNLIDLISNIGGTLGLLTGASFLSIVEIFEIIFLVVSSFYDKTNKVNLCEK